MSENLKAYYAIIPANVRYDEKLTPNAKLMYGEITALCNEKGFCWATNKYFSDLYKKSPETISRWVSSLCNQGYIEVKFTYKSGTKEIDKRIITLLTKTSIPSPQNCQGGIDKNVKENNTITNNTDNKVILSENRFSEEVVTTLEKCLEYFPEHLHPKTQKNRENWLDVVDKLNRLDRIPFEAVVSITKAAREDRFWSSNFLAMTKLRQKDKDQIPYIVVFAERFKPKEQKFNRQTEQEIRNTGKTILDVWTNN